MGRVELTLLLRVFRLDGERLKVVFVHASDEVAVRKVFMRDLADFVDDLLEVVRRDFGAREDFLRERTFESIVVDFKPVEDAVEIDIELVVGLVIGNRLPATSISPTPIRPPSAILRASSTSLHTTSTITITRSQ